jgi:hypothetical protein
MDKAPPVQCHHMLMCNFFYVFIGVRGRVCLYLFSLFTIGAFGKGFWCIDLAVMKLVVFYLGSDCDKVLGGYLLPLYTRIGSQDRPVFFTVH